jgi:hypothetical protein
MAGLYALTLVWDFPRDFYALDLPRAIVFFAAIGIAAMTGTLMYVALVGTRWVQSAPEWMQQAPELLAHAPQAIRQPLEAAGGGRLAKWISVRAGGRLSEPTPTRRIPRGRTREPIDLPVWVVAEEDAGEERSQLELPLD